MRKNKRFIVSKLAAIVRYGASDYLFAKRYARYRREYGAQRKLLSEFNKLCIHRNLPSFIRAKTDYQLARFIKGAQNFMGCYGIDHTEFSLFCYSDRDALVKWFYKQAFFSELPHITGIDDFDVRNEMINGIERVPQGIDWEQHAGAARRKAKRKANQEKSKKRKANKK